MVGIVLGLLVLAGAGWALVSLTGDDADPIVAPPTPTPTPTPSSPTTPSPSPSNPDDLEDLLGDGGILDDLLGDGGLEDLLGEDGLDDLLGEGFDEQLLACLAPPDAQPSLESTPLPDDPAEAIGTISDQVAELRGLAFTDDVDLELLSSDELAARVDEAIGRDYDAELAAVDQAILATLGQVDPDLDLLETYRDLLTEQVAGFYDPDTGELVAAGSSDLAPADRVIVAHELDHALTDQALGLPDLEGEDDIDGILARQGLVEGDATVLMQHWAAVHLSLMDQFTMAVPQTDTQALDTAPHVLQQQLLYPYTAGMEFVCSQYAEGGWAAVDAMYDDLPITTAQVLWPERYAADEQAEPVPPVALPGAEQLRETTWGAADLLWLLEAPGDDATAGLDGAEDLARDWTGGALTAWEDDTGTTVTLRVAQQSGGDLCTTFTRWHEAAFEDTPDVEPAGDEAAAWAGAGRAGVLTCTDELVTVTVGPDLATVRTVEDA